jgi:hypothetical protein
MERLFWAVRSLLNSNENDQEDGTGNNLELAIRICILGI